MAEFDKDEGVTQGLSRRDFLKASAAAAAVGAAGVDFAVAPATAAAALTPVTTFHTTCPYCSASCGQLVDVDGSGNVVDVYGDYMSPFSSGGLCAKGAGAYQLATNKRRIGAYAGAHPVDPVFEAKPAATVMPAQPAGWTGTAYTGSAFTYAKGVAYWRLGNGGWNAVPLDVAMDDIGTRLVAARGATFKKKGDTAALFSAGVLPENSVTYAGFSGLQTVPTGGATYVLTSGTKDDPATLGAKLTTLAADPTNVPARQAVLDAFDELVFVAVDPASRSTYKLVGTSTLGQTMLDAGVMGNTADIIADGGLFRAYVCDITGQVYTSTSSNMLAWSAPVAMGSPTASSTTGIKSPSVIKSGTKLHFWSTRLTGAAVEDNTLWYSSYETSTSSWTGPVPVTHGGSQLTAFAGHPFVTSDGVKYTMHFSRGDVEKATAPVATPETFSAAAVVYAKPASSQGNICALPSSVIYTTYTYPDPLAGLGWAYTSIEYYVTTTTHNSKGVAFFGSSHMNNEQNYTYRKIIADFGTSNVEHQARI